MTRRDWAGARRLQNGTTDSITVFGLFAVTGMLVTYAMEDRSPWFISWSRCAFVAEGIEEPDDG
jgi:hypothetical protein